MRISTLYTLLQFLLWCLSIQKSMQAVMSPSMRRSLRDTSENQYGTTRTRTLLSRNSGHYVRIVGRNVDANAAKDDPDALLLIRTVDFNEVVIQGNKSRHHICINSKGDLVARKRVRGGSVSCVFSETYSSGGYNEFRSVSKTGWMLGFRNTGTPRKAQRNRVGQRATHFMIMPSDIDVRENVDAFDSVLEELSKKLRRESRGSDESSSRLQSRDSNR